MSAYSVTSHDHPPPPPLAKKNTHTDRVSTFQPISNAPNSKYSSMCKHYKLIDEPR